MILMTETEKQELKNRETKGTYLRQGCVLFYRTDSIPASLHRDESGVIAEGAATGIHKLADVGTAEVFVGGRERFLRVGKRGATIIHRKHSPKKLEAGTYRIETVSQDNILFKIERRRMLEFKRNAELGIQPQDERNSQRIGNEVLAMDDMDRAYKLPAHRESAFWAWNDDLLGTGDGEHDEDWARYQVQISDVC